MRYRNFDPKATGPPQPSKDHLLAQIEADHFAAKGRGDEEEMKRLDQRYALVKAESTDEQARAAYEASLK